MVDLDQVIATRLLTLKRGIDGAKSERDNAPSAMESHSDQTRSVAEQLHASLEREYRSCAKLKGIVKRLPIFHNQADLNTIVTVSTLGVSREYLLVPEGLGGIKVGTTFLLSEKSPLAQALIGHSSGYKFIYSDQSFVLNSVKPNE